MANAAEIKVPGGFEPARDGFAFTNSWPDAPAVTVPTPFGQVGIGNAANGLCGGMVFAALDYWIARQAPPKARPAPGVPLYKFIVRRLVDSWHVPAGVVEYYQWMNLPDGDVSASVLGRWSCSTACPGGRSSSNGLWLRRASMRVFRRRWEWSPSSRPTWPTSARIIRSAPMRTPCRGPR